MAAAALGPIMLGMFGISVVATLGFSSIGNVNQQINLNKKIDELTEKNDDLQKQYDDILNQTTSIDLDIQSRIIELLDDHKKLAAQIRILKQQHQDYIKRIQLIGVIFISIIIFAFLTKIIYRNYFK